MADQFAHRVSEMYKWVIILWPLGESQTVFQTAPDFDPDSQNIFCLFSAVSVNPNDQPVIFHRGHVVWDAKSFGRDYKLVAPTLIGEDTIVTLDADSGKPLSSFGKDLFLMPHGLTVDNEGNIYVTDVGLHQVMRVSYVFLWFTESRIKLFDLTRKIARKEVTYT